MKYPFKNTKPTVSIKLFLSTIILALSSYVCEAQDQLKAEYEKLEETRAKFMQALKDKRYDIIATIGTQDAQSIGPATSDWQEMRALGKSRGMFPYDSIIMFPKETVIVSDSIAYDFGVSKVYYTNNEGEVVELQDTFLVILKKTKDGVWKLHREVASGQVRE